MDQLEGVIRQLLEEKFREQEFSDCFIIEISLSAARQLSVFIDSDSNITFEKCRKISRYLEQHLDEEGWLGEKYVLEVSSPGVDRPLKFLRQYRKNIGRKLKVKLLDGSKYTGRLTAVEGETLLIEEKVASPGKGKKKILKETEIPLDQIKKATVIISFK
jgi:ribosome maturation factor RimP